MDDYDDLWHLQSEQQSFEVFDTSFQHLSAYQHALNQQTLLLQANYLISFHTNLQTVQQNTQQCSDSQEEDFSPPISPQNCSNSSNGLSSEQQKKSRRKQTKPSPYHNYQKHLNLALKHLIAFPIFHCPSQQIQIAHQLWNIFLVSRSPTKKIFHFIFNEFNEYRIKQADLKEFGFEDIYSHCSHQTLAEARTFLTNLAIQQMDDENIDSYLETRRIKNPLKFKKYILLFRQELQDGFLKKRFTNLSRKEQYRRELMRCNK